ncbi:MAG: hypothetical protein ACREX3_07720 [Gammaproteobacteria bacterium]
MRLWSSQRPRGRYRTGDAAMLATTFGTLLAAAACGSDENKPLPHLRFHLQNAGTSGD